MKCSNCGATLREGTAFCPACGAKVEPKVRYCDRCGERLQPGYAFCTNCGNPVSGGSSGSGRKQKTPGGGFEERYGSSQRKGGAGKKRTGIIIGAAAAAVILIFVILLLTGVLLSPAARFKMVVKKSVVEPATSAVDKVLSFRDNPGLSTDMTISASAPDSYSSEIYNDITVDLKVKAEKKNTLVNVDVNWLGSDVLSGAFTYDGDQFGFYLPDLDSGYYVVDIDQLFGNYEYAQYGLFEVGIDIDSKLVDEVISRYADVVLSCVNAGNMTVSRNERIRLVSAGETVTGVTAYTFQPTGEDISEMLTKLADTIEKDKDLRELMVDTYGAYLLADGDAENEADVRLQIEDMIVDFADQMRNMAEFYGYDDMPTDFSWTIYMKGTYLYREEIVPDGDYSEALVFERYGEESSGITYCVGMCYLDENEFTEAVTLQYQKSGKTLTGDLSYMPEYGDTIKASFDLNLAKQSALKLYYGTYRLDAGDVTAKLEVDSNGSGSEHKLRLSGDDLDYSIGVSNLTVSVITTDRSSTAKEPSAKAQDISDYSEEEFSELWVSLLQNADYILEDLM